MVRNKRVSSGWSGKLPSLWLPGGRDLMPNNQVRREQCECNLFLSWEWPNVAYSYPSRPSQSSFLTNVDQDSYHEARKEHLKVMVPEIPWGFLLKKQVVILSVYLMANCLRVADYDASFIDYFPFILISLLCSLWKKENTPPRNFHLYVFSNQQSI